jgi:hypothetical protein
MLSSEEKKQAIRRYKECKPLVGVFAVRCAVSGQVWVGFSRNLDATRNSVWFSLRNGGHRDRALQEEWNAHGEPGFSYELLEKLEDDVPALAVSDRLRDRKQHWMSELGARGLL